MKKLPIATIVAMTVAFVQYSDAQGQDRTARRAANDSWPTSWRPTVMSKNGMVTAGHPLAAAAGLKILQAGGNAMDAAIATWGMQGVVESPVTGFGADMFIILYDAKTKTVKVINGTGVAPQRATINYYRSRGGIPEDGPLATSVPGAVAGAVLAIEKYGTRPLSEVWAPAIQAADTGFPISEGLATTLKGAAKKLGKFESSKKVWFRDGKPLQEGDIVVQKDLANTMRTVATKGWSGFYEGPVAKNFAAYEAARGGIITEADLEAVKAEIDEPVKIDYHGVDVYAVGPNSQGFVTLEALNILKGFNLQYMGYNSAPYLHVITESLKLAMADRNKYVSDPRFTPNIPMKELLSDEYAVERRKLIDPYRAIVGEPPAGNPFKSATMKSARARYASNVPMPSAVNPWTKAQEDETLGLTTYLSVIDKDHNMVSITSSLLAGWGNGMIVDGGGFFLNNRMDYFYLDPSDVNALVPGKRTRQTINPQLALKDGQPFMVFGTPGGDTQPQCQLQFFLNFTEWGMSVQQALEADSVISSSFRGSEFPHEVAGTLLTPVTLPEATKTGLAALGHKLDIRPSRGVGAVKAIVINEKTGALMGGVSPTRESYVMAW